MFLIIIELLFYDINATPIYEKCKNLPDLNIVPIFVYILTN